MDKTTNEPYMGTKYTLNSKDGVKQLLEDIPYLQERRYHQGDYDACDILMDYETAMNRITNAPNGLTNRQRQAMELIYIEGYTTVEAGKIMGVIHATAWEHAEIGCEKLAKCFAKWLYNEVN